MIRSNATPEKECDNVYFTVICQRQGALGPPASLSLQIGSPFAGSWGSGDRSLSELQPSFTIRKACLGQISGMHHRGWDELE